MSTAFDDGFLDDFFAITVASSSPPPTLVAAVVVVAPVGVARVPLVRVFFTSTAIPT